MLCAPFTWSFEPQASAGVLRSEPSGTGRIQEAIGSFYCAFSLSPAPLVTLPWTPRKAHSCWASRTRLTAAGSASTTRSSDTHGLPRALHFDWMQLHPGFSSHRAKLSSIAMTRRYIVPVVAVNALLLLGLLGYLLFH